LGKDEVPNYSKDDSMTGSQTASTDAPKPLVSILIPAYNAEEWIVDTLRSAIAQTWDRKEIIVVDDGSEDRTLAIARQFESDVLRVVTQANQGAAAARNTALTFCRGDYIQWLDADDLLAPDKIARQMEVVEECANKRVLVSSAWGSFLHRYHRARFVPTDLWCDLSPVEWLLRKMGQNLYMQTATWLISRELTEAAGPWDCTMFVDDDGEYLCRVLLASSSVRFVRQAKVYYRSSGSGSLSYIGRSDRKMEAQLRSMQLHIGYLLSLENSERTRTACAKHLQTWIGAFYPFRLDLVQTVEQMAKGLGGRVEVPRLSWKYAWIRNIFGWDLALRVQRSLNWMAWSIVRLWGRVLFAFENRKVSTTEIEKHRVRIDA
jgi:glycosyltransferase involved in cell wall biosynthesis